MKAYLEYLLERPTEIVLFVFLAALFFYILFSDY
jgi:hypothetical protein